MAISETILEARRAELLEGLDEGSLVVVFPPSDLTDGTSVQTSG
ncbi:MAG: hypothetical protein WEA34_02860 [Gemmatimonadota bacterium]